MDRTTTSKKQADPSLPTHWGQSWRLSGLLGSLSAALCVAVLASCGGGAEDSATGQTARNESRVRALSSSAGAEGIRAPLGSTQAVSNPAAASFIGILGYGTNRSPDGFFLSSRALPINNAGVIAINKVISEYTNPDPDPAVRDGFLLTSDGVTYESVPAGGTGQLLHFGYSINDAGRLTFQRGPVNSGTPQAYQFFSREAPYSNLQTYSPACTCYGFDLHTNAAGKGVMLVRTTDFNQPSVLLFDGQGGSQALAIDPTYLRDRPLSKTKILSDGTVYVGLLNFGNQSYEIWRFANGETQAHTVAYSLPTAVAALDAWDVNEIGTLAVVERGLAGSVVKTVTVGGNPVVVNGTETGDYGLYTSVSINLSGLIAAVNAYQSGVNQGRQELLYVSPGGSPVRVLATGDALNGGIVLNITPYSEMNESGQLTLFMQLDTSPEPYPIRSLASLVTPLFPTLSTFAPASGTVGSSVVISGKNLGTATAVAFNGTNASFTIDSTTQITATVPAGATTGPLSVTTPAGTATTPTDFTVTSGLAPTVNSFSPIIGGVGTSVTIKGANLNFAGPMTVQFNGIPASFRVKGSSQIVAIVPDGATTGPIAVTTAWGTAATATDFTVVPPPTIAGFSPDSGARGTTVTITGTDFVAVQSVLFHVSRATFTVVSPTMITAVVPRNVKTGPIRVSTVGGTATSSSSFTPTK